MLKVALDRSHFISSQYKDNWAEYVLNHWL